MQFRLKWAVIKDKGYIRYVAVLGYLVLVDEIDGVGGNNSMVISLGESSPFVAEAPGLDSAVTTL